MNALIATGIIIGVLVFGTVLLQVALVLGALIWAIVSNVAMAIAYLITAVFWPKKAAEFWKAAKPK
jgi:uncharacterized membrane protein YciS (DUF1049 family)